MDVAIPVTLIVKAPNQQFEDQTIQCELTWTIKRLKGYLSEVYPCKPVSKPILLSNWDTCRSFNRRLFLHCFGSIRSHDSMHFLLRFDILIFTYRQADFVYECVIVIVYMKIIENCYVWRFEKKMFHVTATNCF